MAVSVPVKTMEASDVPSPVLNVKPAVLASDAVPLAMVSVTCTEPDAASPTSAT